jgi:hypothetical protein
MNWKDLVGSGRGLSLRYYPCIRLQGLRKTTKTSISITGRRHRKSNPGPPGYEVRALTRPRRSAYLEQFTCRVVQIACPNGNNKRGGAEGVANILRQIIPGNDTPSAMLQSPGRSPFDLHVLSRSMGLIRSENFVLNTSTHPLLGNVLEFLHFDCSKHFT